MKFKNYLLLCLVALLAVTACKKSSTPKPGTTSTQIDTDVYVAGSIRTIDNSHWMAVYWKNGVLDTLSDPLQDWHATGITVYGGKVYVSGYRQVTATSKMAAYWVNGEKHELELSTVNSTANGVGVNNNGVYVAGIIDDGTTHAVYWENYGSAARVLATGFSSEASGVYASGYDFYIAGSVNASVAYWKNGGLINTVNLYASSLANTIAFDGTHVYAVGYTLGYVAGSTSRPDTATYWKDNGTAQYLTDGKSYGIVNAIAIDGSKNVYMAGYGDNAAEYWKNNATSITKIADAQSLTGIAVVGNDVFVDGLTTSNYVAYWKNGFKKILPRGIEVKGMVVVTHPH